MTAALLLAALAGCGPAGAPVGADDGPFHDGVPSITSVEWGCDADAASWTFTVETDAWTDGAWLWMARDALTSERHRIYSSLAAADGSWDTLELELDVVADWRDADESTLTRWQCIDEDALSFLLTVRTPRGDETSDCRTWGADPDVFAEVEGTEPCETVLVEGGG